MSERQMMKTMHCLGMIELGNGNGTGISLGWELWQPEIPCTHVVMEQSTGLGDGCTCRLGSQP